MKIATSLRLILSFLTVYAAILHVFGASDSVFDVTLHGVVPDGETESSSGFMSAWQGACNQGASATFYVPEGKYYVGPLQFSGPCKDNESPKIVINGHLIAPAELDIFPTKTWIEFSNLNGVSIAGEPGKTRLDAQGEVKAWKQQSCRKSATCKTMITSLKFDHVSNGEVSNILLSNSKGFHMAIHESNDIKVHDIAINAPGDSHNTDGIHVAKSSNVEIYSSSIGVGDDCISIGEGSVNVSISHVNCGPGHGISIGSLGKYKNEEDVIGISVKNCKIKSTTNGIRIKTWPGSSPSNAYNMTFEDIEMTRVSNPIIIDQQYCPRDKCDPSKPSQVKLRNISIENVRGTYKGDTAISLLCSPSVACENVKLVDVNLKRSDNYDNDYDDWREGRMKLSGALDGLQIINSKF